METHNQEARNRHWIKSRNLTFAVLAIWFVFSILVHVFAKSLNATSFIGFPLGYYMAVQGSLVIFVLLIFFQNFVQDRIDDEFTNS